MASQSKPTNSKAYARSNASSTSQASGTGTAASRHSNVNAARDEESKTLPSNEKASYDSHFTSYLYPFAGMIHDVRVRMPHYWSDITDGFTYRTLAATLRIYFLNLIPALAYTMDMYKRTHQNYGENEALLASALGGIVFGVFSVQPITIGRCPSSIYLSNVQSELRVLLIYSTIHPGTLLPVGMTCLIYHSWPGWPSGLLFSIGSLQFSTLSTLYGTSRLSLRKHSDSMSVSFISKRG